MITLVSRLFLLTLLTCLPVRRGPDPGWRCGACGYKNPHTTTTCGRCGGW